MNRYRGWVVAALVLTGGRGLPPAVVGQSGADRARQELVPPLSNVQNAGVRVPSLRGLSSDSAQRLLARLGLVLGVRRTERPGAIGVIEDQIPKADAMVPRQTRVEVTIAMPPAARPVPNLRGRRLSDLLRPLSVSSPIVIGKVETARRAGGDSTIIDQRPDTGETMVPGTPINVTIALPLRTVRVPPVEGLTRQAALRRLVDSSLGATIASMPSQPARVGRVITQLPSAGAVVDSGSPVRLTIGARDSGHTRIRVVPSVIGLTRAHAETTLQARDLELVVATDSGARTIDSVVAQVPTAGSRQQAGDTVRVTLAPDPSTPAAWWALGVVVVGALMLRWVKPPPPKVSTRLRGEPIDDGWNGAKVATRERGQYTMVIRVVADPHPLHRHTHTDREGSTGQ